MRILIGMDEAGYGPNLGPLVVAATAWKVTPDQSKIGARRRNGTVQDSGGSGMLAPVATKAPAATRSIKKRTPGDEVDLYQLLRPVIARKPSDRCIAIADSKALYKPGLGLRQLERGVHAVLSAIQQSLASWSELIASCAADPNGHHRHLPWHDGFDCSVPVDATSDELSRLGPRLLRACERAQVRPLAIRARLVYPAEFNELVEYYGTKGGALSHVTVGLLREVIDSACAPREPISPHQPQTPGPQSPASRPPISVVCDKHGGRNYYAALLQHHFSEHWIEPILESQQESRYAWGPKESRVRVQFRVGGESFLPTALASMTAKYLRELAMRAWNEFWCARIKDLRPTAGYYGDSRRFKADIEQTQRSLGIEDRILWRER
jgi:hypothetical protein